MRLRTIRGRARPFRCALLPRRDPLHHLRSGGRVPVPLGGLARRYRAFRLLVDGGVPGRADGRLRLRVAQGSARMGVIDEPGRPLPPDPKQDLLLKAATAEIEEKGFLVTKLDDLVNWARSGS